MSNYTKITLARQVEADTPVFIAGNFNGWKKEPLAHNAEGRYEYVIKQKERDDASGKYIFKFVIDDSWKIDSNYSVEIDGNGNENNVILYDYGSSSIAGSEDQQSRSAKEQSFEEPDTPNPTPYSVSKQVTVDDHDHNSSKPTYNGPKEKSNGPFPVETVGSQLNIKPNVSPSEPSERPTANAEGGTNDAVLPVSPQSSGEATPFHLGFIATILHLISELFKKWFTHSS